MFFSLWHPYVSDIGTFKVVPEVSQLLLIFLNSCFFILFRLDVYFFLLFQIFDVSPSFLPFTVGSLYILLYFAFFHFVVAFICSFILRPSSIISVRIVITSVLNSASDRLAISSLLSCIFTGVFDLLFHLGLSFSFIFFVSAHLLHCKGRSLRYSPGWGNTLCCVVALCLEEGSEREQCPLLLSSCPYIFN